MPDARLSIVVQHADGRTTRWGPDEVDGRNIPTDLSWETSIPGGFGSMSSPLLRRLGQQYPDQDLFDTVTVYGSGGRIAYQGRMAQFPRSHADSYAITPGAVGWVAHLRDDPSFREVYVDRDLSRWGGATLARRQAIAAAGLPQGKITASTDAGGIAFLPPNESIPSGEIAEVIYDAGVGIAPAAFYYQGTQNGAWTSFEAATIFNGTDPANPTFNIGTLTLDGTVHNFALTPRRYLMMRARTTAIITPAVGHSRTFDKVAVYGNSGLATRTITGEPPGVYASDILADAITRAAPLLTYSGDATSFAIPHAVYSDPTTAEFVVADVNKYHLYDWGVYENLEFFYRQPDPDRLCWEARLGDGAHMDADGLTGEQVYNGVFVAYQDGTGKSFTVGPPGGNFDATDSVLQDTSSSNPANSHGIPAKWAPLTLTFPTTLAGATQIGYVYLAERSLTTRRGQVTVTGTINHPTEGKVPVWRVRAGDWIRVTDLDGENASVQRKIIATSYAHGSRTLTATLDNTSAKLDAILSRVGVETGIMAGGGF